MKKTNSLDLLATLSLSAIAFSSAKLNTAFVDPTGADPLNAYNLSITDGNIDSGGAAQAGESIETLSTTKTAGTDDAQQVDDSVPAAAIAKAEIGTENAAT